MQIEELVKRRTYHTKVDASGRIVIPSESKLRKQLKAGDSLVFSEGPDDIQLMTLEESIKLAQDYFKSIIPPEVDLVSELMAERRAEAERE